MGLFACYVNSNLLSFCVLVAPKVLDKCCAPGWNAAEGGISSGSSLFVKTKTIFKITTYVDAETSEAHARIQKVLSDRVQL